VPTQPLREMGASRVLAVSLKGKWTNVEGPRHVFEVIGQCFAIAQEMNSSQWKRAADLVVEPEVHEYKYDAFDQSAALVLAGETAMRAALADVRKWLQPQLGVSETAREVRVSLPAAASAD
jgi:NTE family protein